MKSVIFLGILELLYATVMSPPEISTKKKCMFWSHAENEKIGNSLYEPMGFKKGHYVYVLNSCPYNVEKACSVNLYVMDLNNQPLELSRPVKCNIPAGFGYSWTYDEEDESLYIFSGNTNKGESIQNLYKVTFRYRDCVVTVLDFKSEKKPEPRSYGTLTLFKSQYGKYIILFGGFNDADIFDNLWIFSINSGTWISPRVLGASISARKGHSSFILVQSSICYIFYSMGVGVNGYMNDIGIVKIQSYQGGEVLVEWVNKDSFELAGSLPSPREGAMITSSENGYLIIGGCNYEKNQCYNDVHLVYIQLDGLGNRKIQLTQSFVINKTAAMSGRELGLLVPISYGIFILGGHNFTTEAELSLLLTNSDCENTCNLMHGHFRNGVCECDEGWSGTYCDIHTACPKNCSDRGECIRGVCQCRGSYFGDHCQHAHCKNNCYEKGECNIQTGRCKCFPSYIGEDCSIKADDNYSLIQFNHSTSSYSNYPETISEALLSPISFESVFHPEASCTYNCRDRGSCLDGKCYCNPPYFGESCEYTHCTSDCGSSIRRGTCNHSSGKCECFPNYGGNSCEFECLKGCPEGYLCVEDNRCECDDCPLPKSAQKCNERGVMIEGKCDCMTGYCGIYCEFECYDCSGHGVYKGNFCDCERGYWGDRCQFMCANRCSNSGECRDGECVCERGWIGEDCSIYKRCSGMCNERGECNHRGECECYPGYMGKGCEIEICPRNCTVLSISYELYSPEGNLLSSYSSRDQIPYLPNSIISEIQSTAGFCNSLTSRCECYPGYTGPSCDTLVPCLRNCTDHGICQVTGECVCYSGFRGRDCSLKECPHNCLDNVRYIQGICNNNGICECYPGFFGGDCSFRCINNCSGNGECINHECRCKPGFIGEDCSVNEHCPKCVHGKCERGVCKCEEGYAGESCSEIVCECIHGTCIDVDCICDTGFMGKDCSVVKECPNKCSGKGMCQYGKCYCEPGYTGTDCSEAIKCPENCPPGALCVNGRCYCEGRLECGPICPNSCSGHGICNHHGRCLCQSGYYGEDCSHIHSISKCGKHGKDNKGTCECDLGWAGEDCSIAVAYSCPGKNCNGHGVCHMGVCACDPDYEGIDCSIKKVCIDGCNGRGVCKYGRCYCNPGYSGSACQTAEKEDKCEQCSGICIGNTCYCAKGDSHCTTFIESKSIVTGSLCEEGCNGNGDCIDGGCVCRKGYTGSTCNLHSDEDIEKCYIEGLECSHNGMCFNGKCHCYPSFQGKFCQERIGCEECKLPHQLCHFGMCVCESGWSGPLCDIEVACNGIECGPNGICSEGECLCKENYISNVDGKACVYKYNIPLLVLLTSIIYGILIGSVWRVWSNKF